MSLSLSVASGMPERKLRDNMLSIYNTIGRAPFVDPLGNPFEIFKETGNRALVWQSSVRACVLRRCQ